MSAAKTIDKFVVNADSAASGNVNKDGGTPASTMYYMQGDNGLRKTAIADTNTVDVTTLANTSFTAMFSKVDDRYTSELQNLLWIMPRNVYNKALLLTDVVSMEKYGQAATINTGRLGQIFGVDILTTPAIPSLALATGKVHTSSGNTLGQMLLVYKPAVQYGFGQPLEIQIQPVPGKGALMYATFEFGFGIVYDKAGLGKTIALGRNVTVQPRSFVTKIYLLPSGYYSYSHQEKRALYFNNFVMEQTKYLLRYVGNEETQTDTII